MTTLATAARTPVLSRPAAATLAALGPLAVAATLVVLPYSASAGVAEIAPAAASHPAAMSAVVWLELLASLTLVAGAAVVGATAVRADALWGRLGAVLTVAGFAAAFAAFLPDLVAEAGTRAGLDPVVVSTVLGAVSGHPAWAAALVLFLAGPLLGLIALGVAFLRSGAAPRWAAIALIVSAPLHVVFTAAAPSALLAGLSWALTAAGMAGATLGATQKNAQRVDAVAP